MTPFEFTESMNEITGYGGTYESACRAAVCAGAAWFATHPDSDPIFIGGLPHNDDAEHIAAAIGNAWFTHEDGRRSQLGDYLTTSMFSLVMYHVYYIAKHGWRAYVQKMSAPLAIVEGSEEPGE